MAQGQARLLRILDTLAATFWSRPWRVIGPGLWLLALFWWIIEPWGVHEFGRKARATVVDAWQTNSFVNVLVWTWRLDGVRLGVTLPDGSVGQVKKYCREELIEGERLGQRGSQFEVRLDPVAPWRVVLESSTCDFEQSFYIGLVLLLIGGWAVWKWLGTL